MKMHYPAADRNVVVIGDAIESFLPSTGTILEIASGTGQHVCALAERFPHLTWQPSDPDAPSVLSIASYVDDAKLDNLREPLTLDVTDLPWPVTADLVLCSNMVHIAPWAPAEALMAGAGACLASGARLITYGPYNIDGKFTSDSNRRFDTSLRSRNAAWGVRDLADLQKAGQPHGLTLSERIAMPANNFTLIWTKD